MAGVFLDIDGKIKAINLQPQNYILLLKLAIFSKTQYFDKLLKNFTKTRIFFSKSGQVVTKHVKTVQTWDIFKRKPPYLWLIHYTYVLRSSKKMPPKPGFRTGRHFSDMLFQLPRDIKSYLFFPSIVKISLLSGS